MSEHTVTAAWRENAIRSTCQRAIDRAAHHLAIPDVPRKPNEYQAETDLAYAVLDLLGAPQQQEPQ